jgi:glycosyltransferase involved in cell wall biosynthesis
VAECWLELKIKGTVQKMNAKTISIVLPALNEEEHIGKVIAEIPGAELEERGYSVRILVVDNNSTDSTG